MPTVGIIVGSLSSKSINRELAKAIAKRLPEDVESTFIEIADLPLYTPDADADYPAPARAFKQAIEAADGIIIVTPEYSRSIPGALKNALDWAARPWGTNSFNGKPVAIAGASGGPIGTAAAQQHLRAILGHLNTLTLGQPETFVRFSPEAFPGDGEIADPATEAVVSNFAKAAAAHISRFAAVTI